MSVRSVIALGARGNIKEVRGTMERVNALAQGLRIEIQLLDAVKVYGEEHLIMAGMHAIRAFGGPRALANSLAMEVLLYASGKRQISEAIDLMGIHEGTMEIAVLVIGDARTEVPDDIVSRMDLERDDFVLEGTDEALEALGIDENARRWVPRERYVDLVLEKIALLEIGL